LSMFEIRTTLHATHGLKCTVEDLKPRSATNVFHALHRGPRAFIIANAWDAGSARILTGLGFPPSARRVGIADATDLPVSADLENGFGATPREVANVKPPPQDFSAYAESASVPLIALR
jgi:hypothetical protein